MPTKQITATQCGLLGQVATSHYTDDAYFVPSDNVKPRKASLNEPRIEAHVLFSSFTADIIKDNKIFIR